MHEIKLKILVTGASGFIGDYVVKYLCDNTDHEIYILSRDTDKLVDKPWYSRVNLIKGDIRTNKTDWFKFLEKPDKLIHLAWDGLPNYNQSFHLTENLVNDFNFLSNLIKNGLTDITITGTCFEYGMLEGELFENMPTNPTNYYALAKDTLRKMLELFQSKNDFNLKWVRLFYMYGSGQNPNSIIPQLEKALNSSEQVFNMSGGEQIRDYLHVKEVANNIVEIALQSKISGILNNCSGSPIKLIDLVKGYLEQRNLNINLNLGYYPYSRSEPMAFWGNTQKLNQIKSNVKSKQISNFTK